jgi:hypothetical protein
LPPTDEVYKRLIDNIYKKHCYLVAFDYKENSGLLQQLQDIMLAAAGRYASQFNYREKPKFVEFNSGQYLHSPVLAMTAQRNPTLNTPLQVEKFLNDSHEKMLTAIDNYVTDYCSNSTKAIRNEDTFTQTLREIAGADITIASVRALEEGYSMVNTKILGGKHDMWKPEVLMTEGELDKLNDVLLGFSSVSANNTSEQADKIVDLWAELANKYVGDDIQEKDIIDLTPSQVLDQIVKSPYHISEEKVVLKTYTLRQIKSRDENAKKHFDEYIKYVNNCAVKLKDIKNKRLLEFKNSEDKESNISYFWIPLDILP